MYLCLYHLQSNAFSTLTRCAFTLYEYMDRKKLLSKPEEVTRLIKALPRITADTAMAEESSRASLDNVSESKQGLSALPTPGMLCFLTLLVSYF